MVLFAYTALFFIGWEKDIFVSYSPAKQRLDKFLYEYMAGEVDYALLWRMLRKLLILSHGQATVERGFSINSHCTEDNLEHLGLQAKRRICDYVQHIGVYKIFLLTKSFWTVAVWQDKSMIYTWKTNRMKAALLKLVKGNERSRN